MKTLVPGFLVSHPKVIGNPAFQVAYARLTMAVLTERGEDDTPLLDLAQDITNTTLRLVRDKLRDKAIEVIKSGGSEVEADIFALAALSAVDMAMSRAWMEIVEPVLDMADARREKGWTDEEKERLKRKFEEIRAAGEGTKH